MGPSRTEGSSPGPVSGLARARAGPSPASGGTPTERNPEPGDLAGATAAAAAVEQTDLLRQHGGGGREQVREVVATVPLHPVLDDRAVRGLQGRREDLSVQ